MGQLSLHIKPLQPFRLDLTVWALRRQPHNKIDLWDGKTYTRVFVLNGRPLKVEVRQEDQSKNFQLSVLVSGRRLGQIERTKLAISRLLQKILGTNENVDGFYRIADNDPQLSLLAKKFIGLKPPRFPTVFETLINAFACQQLSLNVGLTLLNRLAEAYGRSFDDKDSPLRAFPLPEDLAAADPSVLRKLGFSRNKGQAIIGLARSVLDKKPDLESFESMSDRQALDVLLQLRGVGRWSAEYVLLRGLRRLAVFPGDDAGAQNNLQKFLPLKERPDYTTIKQIMLRWQPYQGFVYFHFLLDKLWSKGLLHP
jgi:DNA-3-methyladenine glycosylase II